jgi:hypothetical protein
MRQRIWRPLIAAAVGLFITAGGASAQSPTAPPPVAVPPVVSQPAPALTVPSVPPAVVVPIGPGPNGVVFAQNGTPPPANGVTGGRGYFMSGPVTETRLGSGINGCGSCKQDFAFVFGPCKSFFAPCGGLASGCFGGGHGGWGGGWGGGCGRGGCITPVYGTGIPYGMNPCHYDSYLRH